MGKNSMCPCISNSISTGRGWEENKLGGYCPLVHGHYQPKVHILVHSPFTCWKARWISHNQPLFHTPIHRALCIIFVNILLLRF